MATNVRIIAVTQSPTGLPKDKFESVWYFTDVASSDPLSVAKTGMIKLYDFFHTAKSGAFAGSVDQNLASSVGNEMGFTAYDMAATEPRPEISVAGYVYTPLATSDPVPEEIALCLSYYTDRNVVSHRGRIYIGPFNNEVLTGSGPSRPSANLVNQMAAGGTRLKVVGAPSISPTWATAPTGGGTALSTTAWALHSVKLGTFAAILDGWVDDEWDGQRRRRVEASTRVTY
jgi:hypothetical protein